MSRWAGGTDPLSPACAWILKAVGGGSRISSQSTCWIFSRQFWLLCNELSSMRLIGVVANEGRLGYGEHSLSLEHWWHWGQLASGVWAPEERCECWAITSGLALPVAPSRLHSTMSSRCVPLTGWATCSVEMKKLRGVLWHYRCISQHKKSKKKKWNIL